MGQTSEAEGVQPLVQTCSVLSSGKKPNGVEGFQPLTPEEFNAEVRRMKANHGHDVESTGGTAKEGGYIAVEEFQSPYRRWFTDDSDTSLQGAGYQYGVEEGVKGEAILASANERKVVMDKLSGMDDGRVYIHKLDINITWRTNITQAAAAVGITALGIRRTQCDIAADGEVTRPEQQLIIDLIAKARALAK